MNPDILLERDGVIATVTLFNPEKLNALNAAMWRRLREVMGELAADASLRCVIVRGEGPVFAAGGDLEEFRTARADVDRALAYHEAVGAALAAIESCPHPTLAAILGPCVGGGLEIACACDLRIAGDSARFGAPIMKLGFSMYPGELAGFLKLAGPAVAKEILLEGRLLSAAEAYAKGLLTRMVADAELEREAQATAARIASGAPLVARWHKQWIARLMENRPLSLEEKRASFAFLDTQDYAEGMAAFLEKRAPKFTGR
ncbi:enoyl-CoA hydratase/isomerase family protein [Sulfuritalea hydrogenivorans]|jgi:enoyl-CoA hydratase/carnithine racemase|uniref:Enoyl-CoA hydratase n=1 Tax=Sulfuritalea hydrogenivorans sk43H TaxID=1223802 RepID=W0SJH4_9PROT|nr:enoyl-CoA hydratase-related protein [Sulfuritalea hydrogenivorans]MDK9715645.1 enoyl-CoA hydratase-related protein [Sulfuritalea sp.]BAO31329.1 enoyl-CoA hydratase [Sulfuritalea hydrogenivorans sk43H]